MKFVAHNFLHFHHFHNALRLKFTKIQISVAEPPLFWAAPAPAPDGQGPGADSGSDLLVSAPAPGKKRRLHAAPAPFTKIFHFKLSKS